MKGLTKAQLKWCRDNLPRTQWKINDQGRVDVNTYVSFSDTGNTEIKKIPINFGKVSGSFDCSDCSLLTTLEGSPLIIGHRLDVPIPGHFYANVPVSGHFYASGCDSLTSLKGAPKEVEGDFDCRNCNSLVTLEGAPLILKGYFDCDGCTSLNPFHIEIIDDYNNRKIDWPTAHKLIHRPKLAKAHSLGLI